MQDCNALPRNCSDCFESRYILAFHAPARAVAATHSIAAAQQCTVSDAPHNVLTATNIVASKYLLLHELRFSHGKRHSDEDKSASCRQLCSGWASFCGHQMESAVTLLVNMKHMFSRRPVMLGFLQACPRAPTNPGRHSQSACTVLVVNLVYVLAGQARQLVALP